MSRAMCTVDYVHLGHVDPMEHLSRTKYKNGLQIVSMK